jgi:hypothetical protein
MSVAQELVVGNGFEFWGFSRVPKLGDIGAATDRHAGPMSDANFWARTLVLFPAFALSLMAAAHTRVARCGAALAAGLIVIGVYLTGSRGGLITVALAIVAWMALAGGRPRRLLGLAPTVAVVLVLLPGIGTRLATLSQLDDATQEAGDASLVGRVAVQRQGLEMFLDHPALGVGTTQFKDAEIDYLRRSGLTVARVLAPHNLYLEMAAEGGLAGLASWLLFYGTAVWVALRALLLSRAMAQDDPLLDRLLPVAVLAGLVAWATASIFLHLAGLRSLLLVIGLGVALDDRARRRATRGLRTAASDRRPRSWKPLLVTAAVVVVAFALGAAPGLRTTGWSATARLQVVAAETDRAYDHDIATREHLRATLARLVETHGVWQGEVTATVDDSVQATADARTAFITVTGTATDAGRAVDLTIAARDAGIDRIRELDRLLQLDALGEPVIAHRSVRWHADSLRIGALVALVAYWSLVWGRWLRSRWRGAPISIEPAVA